MIHPKKIRKASLKIVSALFILFLFLLPMPRPAYADNIGLIVRGIAKTLLSVAELPASMISGGAQSFPLGILTGTVVGAVKMVGGTLMGAVDIARGAAPYAKYAAIAAM